MIEMYNIFPWGKERKRKTTKPWQAGRDKPKSKNGGKKVKDKKVDVKIEPMESWDWIKEDSILTKKHIIER